MPSSSAWKIGERRASDLRLRDRRFVYDGIIRGAWGHVIDAAPPERIAPQDPPRRRARCPSRRRARGWRPPRSGSTSGRSGTARRAIPRASLDTRGSAPISTARTGPRRSEARGGSCAHQRFAMEQFRHLGHQILCLRASDGLAGHQDDIVSVPGHGRNLSPGRPQDPPGPVPLDRSSHPAGGDHGDLLEPGREEQYHPSPRATVGRRRTPDGPGDACTADVRRSRRARPLRRRRRQDGAAGAGPHADPEPVRLRAVAVVRLIRALTLGHRRFLSMRRPARGRPATSIRARHRSQDKGVDNRKCVKTPRQGARCGKAAVLYSGPLHPPANPAHRRPGADHLPPSGYPPLWKGLCGYAWR